ncbi:MAG: YbaB/EbfC family nucleoid-associated protein, partial [Saprospiraceae bacterium]|nr:YbaB/EbfC family nucleoid-associated protein [Saprospiraceae bacterium]
MKEHQQEMRAKLKEKLLEGKSGEGAVKVVCNGLREIQNVSIDPARIDPANTEALEDLVVVATNRALALAAEVEQDSAQESLKKMMPPGLDGLGNLFG